MGIAAGVGTAEFCGSTAIGVAAAVGTVVEFCGSTATRIAAGVGTEEFCGSTAMGIAAAEFCGSCTAVGIAAVAGAAGLWGSCTGIWIAVAGAAEFWGSCTAIGIVLLAAAEFWGSCTAIGMAAAAAEFCGSQRTQKPLINLKGFLAALIKELSFN